MSDANKPNPLTRSTWPLGPNTLAWLNERIPEFSRSYVVAERAREECRKNREAMAGERRI